MKSYAGPGGRTPQQAALAAAALWTAHTVECAAYGRRNLSGPPTPDGEPSCADDVESKLLLDYAAALAERLRERADRLGLHPAEVDAGLEFAVRTPWPVMQRDYSRALSLIGGRLGPG